MVFQKTAMKTTVNPTVTLSPNGDVHISMLDWVGWAIKYLVLEGDRQKLAEIVWQAVASITPNLP